MTHPRMMLVEQQCPRWIAAVLALMLASTGACNKETSPRAETRTQKELPAEPETAEEPAEKPDTRASNAGVSKLRNEANEAYRNKDFARCGELLDQLGKLRPTSKGIHAYNAASCYTSAGDRDRAFASLDTAARRGYHDISHVKGDEDLAPLHSDPRWQDIVGKIEAADKAYLARINVELYDLYREARQDRRARAKSAARREARHARVAEIMAGGGAKAADDYFHAASVLQSSDQAEGQKNAHEWALEASRLDPAHPRARWLAAFSEDRYLVSTGKPQKYGTQYTKKDGVWVLHDVDPSITDQERAKWDIPPLADAQARAKKMNQ